MLLSLSEFELDAAISAARLVMTITNTANGRGDYDAGGWRTT